MVFLVEFRVAILVGVLFVGGGGFWEEVFLE